MYILFRNLESQKACIHPTIMRFCISNATKEGNLNTKQNPNRQVFQVFVILVMGHIVMILCCFAFR